MNALRQQLDRSYIARFIVAALLQGFVIHLSLYLVPAGVASSIVWPPSAVGLALLWFWGLDLWPALVAAFFGTLLLHGISPPLIATTALGNSLESLVGAFVLRHYTDFDPMLSRLRDALSLILAAFVSSLASASVISLGVALYGAQNTLSSALWIGLWIGHTVSLLSFGPFVLRWVHKPLFTRTPKEWVEGILVITSIVLLTTFMMWTTHGQVGGISFLYILIIPLIWAALRMGPRGMTLALFLFAIISATGIIFGSAAISHTPNPAQTLFGIQMVIGVLSLIFLLFNSITEERKEAIISLRSHVQQLEVALERISTEDQAKTDFIAILAHELRNPLSPILSGLELLKLRNEGQSDVLRMMGAHLNTLARLLDDLLDISRITQKKFKLQKEPVEIHMVVNHAMEMVEPYFETRKHTLTVEVPKEEIWLDADPVRLTQILVNLLNNSARYSNLGAKVSLRVYRDGSEVVMLVKDNGLGIAPERIAHIFEPFGGSSISERRRPGGLRIGLSLARRMAAMHQGTIEAHSLGEGQGAEFVVRIPLPLIAPLPLTESPTRTRSRLSQQPANGNRPQAEKLCILVVDDNEAAAQNLGKLLEHNGHTVLMAYDAPEALTRATQEHPDVALLDIGLPTMDGYELARRMRATQPDIILVALTGYGQAEDRQKAKDAGFSEHMVKPVSIVDVERVLKELHGTHRASSV